MNDNRRPTLAATLWPQQAASRIARFAALSIGGALALAISAKVQVPFYPVPMTLQTLVVLTIGAAFGARLAAATVLLYLAEGPFTDNQRPPPPSRNCSPIPKTILLVSDTSVTESAVISVTLKVAMLPFNCTVLRYCWPDPSKNA